MHSSNNVERIYPKDKHTVRRPDNSKPKNKDYRNARRAKQKARENV